MASRVLVRQIKSFKVSFFFYSNALFEFLRVGGWLNYHVRTCMYMRIEIKTFLKYIAKSSRSEKNKNIYAFYKNVCYCNMPNRMLDT